MSLGELIGAWALAGVTAVLTCVFGYRQWRLLRRRAESAEAIVLRKSAGRRLIVSVLLFVCALLIATPYVTGLAAAVAAIEPHGDNMTPGERSAVRTYLVMWIGVAGFLFIALAIIAYDMWTMRRYWDKSWQRLREDRRNMVERQLALYRQERNSRNGYYSED